MAERTDAIAITGVILAGGRARRMGGVDKGPVPLLGKPMLEYVLDELRPQVEQILINANRNIDTYAAYGYPVVSDHIEGFAGPLSGIAAAMHRCPTSHLMSVPCDGPRLPSALAGRLVERLVVQEAEICAAHDGERVQPVYALVSCELLPSLDAYLQAGERKIDRWFAQHRFTVADFSDQKEAFVNVNTEEQRLALESELRSAPP